MFLMIHQTGTNCTTDGEVFDPIMVGAAECRRGAAAGGRVHVMSNGQRWGADCGPDTQHYRYIHPDTSFRGARIQLF